MRVLLTGGAGYIGSHIAVELLAARHGIVVADDLSNSRASVVERIGAIAHAEFPFYQIDVADAGALDTVFSAHHIDAVIHLAGLKAVAESVAQPTRYYSVNLDTTLTLLDAMAKHGVNRFIFSSSATVYTDVAQVPWSEGATTGGALASPYGWTKYVNEQILRDAHAARPELDVCLLRYFNPIGAHESGLIGEDPTGIPNNLMPYVTQVAVGHRPQLSIFGGDYDTPDGTCIRDYIHVVDLAHGHVAALEKAPTGVSVFNLGTGIGVSVLDLVHAFETATGVSVPYQIVDRRPGDLPAYHALADKAKRDLGWSALKSLEDACADSWRWQSTNPTSYVN
ncbi:MAG: UDP-glucose 4-epimerase GalE [Propionibacteriaceae bacterium]|jgi:UDP-glucose 4-epimerase|nr:UDP-glucose 4-epimerase GalE [Propionibacteriaceae bacterium]